MLIHNLFLLLLIEEGFTCVLKRVEWVGRFGGGMVWDVAGLVRSRVYTVQ